MSKETGGSAFPLPKNPNGGPVDNGMTLRDYFAAKAMASLLVDVGFANEAAKRAGFTLDEYVSKTGYAVADSMLEERNK